MSAFITRAIDIKPFGGTLPSINVLVVPVLYLVVLEEMVLLEVRVEW